MGDRANIVILQPVAEGAATAPRVYLYTHWGGADLPGTLQRALLRGTDRWGQSDYLARIIFCEMIGGDLDGTTGFGISSRLTDNEHPLLVVDCATRRVHLAESDAAIESGAWTRSWAFGEFAETCEIKGWR